MPKKLEAKVKDDYRMGAVMAFSGREYIRGEWRPVPAGSEAEARTHALLETREVGSPEAPAAAQSISAETTEEEKPKRTRRSSKKED